MAEYSGYMYPSAAPLPNIYRRPTKPKLERANSTSKTTTTKSKTSRFRHHRTSSSSESASRSSHETTATTASQQPQPLLRQATAASTSPSTSTNPPPPFSFPTRPARGDQGISIGTGAGAEVGGGTETRPPAVNLAPAASAAAAAAAAAVAASPTAASPAADRRWSRQQVPGSPRPYLDAGAIPTGTASALPSHPLHRTLSSSSTSQGKPAATVSTAATTPTGSDANNPQKGSTAPGPPSKHALAVYVPSHPPSSPAGVAANPGKLASLAASVPYGYSLPPLTAPHKLTNYSAADLKHVTMLSDQDASFKYSKAAAASSSGGASGVGIPFGRTESTSSTSGTTSLRSGTMSGDHPSMFEGSGVPPHKPFIQRNGRTFLNDPSLMYPLPVDLAELHRQSLRTLLLIQVFGGPVCSPNLATKPPLRVLEVGCGSGFWSMMCHRYYAQKGHASISFTGIDVAPLAPGSTANNTTTTASAGGEFSSTPRPDPSMKWRFVRHDMRQVPWPLASDEFDLVMVKDMSLATTNATQQRLMDEYLRVLRPGGTLEVWESDHTIRMLRPHSPEGGGGVGVAAAPRRKRAGSGVNSNSSSDDDQGHDDDDNDDDDDTDEEQDAAESLGAYVMTANTPLSAPLNNFLVEYNLWLLRALEARDLSPVPCTLIGPMLLQESEALADVRSRRLAVPLSEVRWEREGVGGVVTKDGKTYVESGAAGRGRGGRVEDLTAGTSSSGPSLSGAAGRGPTLRKSLSAGQVALRRTALTTVVQQVQSLEGLLRESSGKSQDEWDLWIGKMMNDLMREGGTSWGECLEVGAWWARKRPRKM